MTAKKYLSQIRLLDIKINDGVDDLAQLDAMLKKVTSAMNGEVVVSSKDPDKMTDIIAKMEKLREELNRTVDKYVDIKREAVELLSGVENPTHYKILHSRYVLYKTWDQIACEIGFTYQWVCQLHGVALLEFEEILKKKSIIVDRS